MTKYPLIRKIYLYLFSLIGLVLVTIGAVQLVSLGLKTYVLTKADQFYSYPVPSAVEKGGTASAAPTQQQLDEYQKNQQTAQRQRDAAQALAMIIIGIPLYIYHWSVIKKDQKKESAS